MALMVYYVRNVSDNLRKLKINLKSVLATYIRFYF